MIAWQEDLLHRVEDERNWEVVADTQEEMFPNPDTEIPPTREARILDLDHDGEWDGEWGFPTSG